MVVVMHFDPVWGEVLHRAGEMRARPDVALLVPLFTATVLDFLMSLVSPAVSYLSSTKSL
jgi:hypothetical protein